jgi:hypothetical protein
LLASRTRILGSALAQRELVYVVDRAEYLHIPSYFLQVGP